MSEKLIYWIDDDEKAMYAVTEGIIQKLWQLEEEDDIRSKIIIVGNASDFEDIEKYYSEEDENIFRWRIENLFINACRNIKKQDPVDDLYEKKKHLIEDPITVVFKEMDADVKGGFFSKLNQSWSQQDLGDEDTENYDDAKAKIEKLIEKMSIPKYAMVGIDVILLGDDDNRIMEKKRILSMELYHQLTESGYKCFLYSSEADNKYLIDNWNEVYQRLYGGNRTEILLRQQLTKKGSERTMEKIKDLVERNMGEEV